MREVRFYELIELLFPNPYPNIPRCLSTFIPEDKSNFYLVLEDITASHHSDESVDFQAPEHWKMVVAALAKFHQCFTHKLGDDQIHDRVDDKDDAERYLNKLNRAFKRFESDHREILDSAVLSLMQLSIPLIRAFELEEVVRVHEKELTTILHRDAHVKNFLYPLSEGAEAVIVDWQFWGLGIGAFDLQHLFGSGFSRDLRSHQAELVRHYYDTYQNGLDVDYSWDDCWLDLRKGIIDKMFMPVWQYTDFGWGADRWGKTFVASVENYHALECGDRPSGKEIILNLGVVLRSGRM
ncbi:MAG: phosphotransferase [Brevefilum sp.]